MVEAIPQPVKELWDKWNIRGVIIFSLTLQTILIFCAPNRKRTAKKGFLLLIWSAYLLADWAANFAVGLISDSQGDKPKPDKPQKNHELLAFWAPFLLLHLGGPDTITALALEDNELWLRHLFGLVFQAIAGVYVFIQSLDNQLWVPTILMFVTGVIKYVERTRALYLASLDRFKDSMLQAPDPGPNYSMLMEEYETKKEMKMPTEIIMIEEPETGQKADLPVRPERKLTELEIVQHAYKYFNIFKGLVVDLIFSFQQRDESKKFFDKLKPVEAWKIIEVELSFIYETLFTKVEVLHTWIGLAFRFIALGTLLASFFIFKAKKKHEYEAFDVALTYALLIGGIALDSLSFLLFCVSDWTFAILRKPKEELDEEDTWKDDVINWILSFKKLKGKKCNIEGGCSKGHKVLNRNFVFRRWSEYINAYNLIGFCLKKSPKRIHHNKGYIHRFFDMIIGCLFIDRAINKTIKLIQKCSMGIKEKAHRVHKWIDRVFDCLFKKHWVIRYVLFPVQLYVDFWFAVPHLLGLLISNFLDFFGIKDQVDEIRFVSGDRLTIDMWKFIFKEVQYKSRFADDPESSKRISSARGEWTLREPPAGKAKSETDHDKLLRYVTDVDYDQSILLWHIATEIFYQTTEDTQQDNTHREFSKILSDYMMYLLIMQPTLMSSVMGIGKIRFRDTREEAERFFNRRHLEISSATIKKATEDILSVNTDVEPMDVKGDRSKSVLFDASILAKELMWLQNQREEEMWEVVSKVWVELLSYAATHCASKQHAAQLSKGGELVSFVWLLMAHFGLGDQFQITKGDARAKLIVGK